MRPHERSKWKKHKQWRMCADGVECKIIPKGNKSLRKKQPRERENPPSVIYCHDFNHSLNHFTRRSLRIGFLNFPFYTLDFGSLASLSRQRVKKKIQQTHNIVLEFLIKAKKMRSKKFWCYERVLYARNLHTIKNYFLFVGLRILVVSLASSK